jgi:homogentisate 1,2-dioxygenase
MASIHTMSTDLGTFTYYEITLTRCRSEAIEGALPIGANSPQKPPFGLYAEKLSGTAFTAPRSENQQTWLYRILPSAAHLPFTPRESLAYDSDTHGKKLHHIPRQLRWGTHRLFHT